MLYLQHEPPDWVTLFRGCKAEAFHLEVRDAYAVPTESDRFRRFLEGEPPLPDEHKNRWLDLVQETVGRGVAVSRIRVVTEPHTDYHRWLLSVTGSNVEAGEDIRYVPRHVVGDVPPDDWWLVDNDRVVYNLVNEHEKPAGLAVTTDPRIVQYCQGVRERLWELATPYAEYVKQ
ncbi:hypothetical protein IU459_24100 [Nocardia amamiensis]|uniref:DUF6879 domain-containing protein n=1 Tax=Nocardia amamiensis TaxID=404578 RepID=A0ABS0CXT9_9NOCA|nr:DUF6879 family protein [Nocardia amamiensis]MBF6300602.1 hypothetical protein [Nocardia amamiensis]